MNVTRNGWTAYAIAAVVIVLDQLTKYWILTVLRLPEYATHEVFWPLQFTRIWNQGVSFECCRPARTWSAGACGVLDRGGDLLAAWARSQARLLPALGLGLVIGGAVGNAVDRARFGAVVDFIDVQRLGFFPWIFNVADSGITIGVILLLLDSLRRERPA
jgi:signal peptidase II